MLQSTNRPTESFIHEEVQKMLDEGIVEPLKVLGHHPHCAHDIIVFSETFEDHLIRLRLVLKCLQEAGLKLNSKKCLFAAQTKILGHLVSSNGVRRSRQNKSRSFRKARWALIQEHDFDVKYKTGNSDADALSRNPVEEETETKFQSLDSRGRDSRPEEVQSNALPTRLSGLVLCVGIAPLEKEDSAPLSKRVMGPLYDSLGGISLLGGIMVYMDNYLSFLFRESKSCTS
ncbi:hypothetical protein TNCV_2006511 [Trichonephila clavipes]|nr:hypothetical protein TNCV_2006511 [Trichonephila clavipes]